jgi:hypothetical protein
MNLEELKKEYEAQDNRCTAYPIYVAVQELTCIGVMADGYSVCGGDGENRTEYRHEDLEGCFETRKEVENALEDFYEDENELSDAQKNSVEELNVGYLWLDVEFFLTIKGAEAYMKANAHNHGKLRTYVKWFETRNFEMRGLLKELGFKVQD